MMKARLLISFVGLAAAAAEGQSIGIGGEDGPELRHYSVEVIVFTYEEDVYTGSEVFLPDEPPPDPFDQVEDDGDIPVFTDTDPAPVTAEAEGPGPYWLVVPASSGREFASRPVPQDAHPFRLALLGEDESMLGDALRKFELLAAYETLLHVGWTQPAYDQETTPPIDLSTFGTLPEGLSGSFTLYLSRYLHLVVDVTLDAPGSEQFTGSEPEYSFGDRFRRAAAPRPVRWRIGEDRIFKNGDLRYFDHPRFGILAKVVRVDVADADDGSAPGLSQ